MVFRILSIDGGGIRAIIPARILQRITAQCPDFLSAVDLFSGTSSGSIIALALAAKLSPDQLLEFFRIDGPRVFENNLVDRASSGFGMFAAKYRTSDLRAALSNHLGNTRLSDLSKQVFIPAFELDSMNDKTDRSMRMWKAKFFHNLKPVPPEQDVSLVDLATRSSSAPTYFPIYQGFVDGGMVANNPTMCAVAQALNQSITSSALSDIAVLSLGTGIKAEFEPSMDGDWGLLQWGFKILHMLMEGSVGLVDYQCRQLLGDAYARVNLNLQDVIDLDDVSKLDQMTEMADSFDLAQTLSWIEKYWFGTEARMPR